jgi:hypothetical protein
MCTLPRLREAVALGATLSVALAACGGFGGGAAASIFVRTCSVVGHGGLAADYRTRALVLGPLALANVRTYRASQAPPGHVGGRYGAYEIIAVVRHGATVTLRLPRSEWATVGLLYDPNKFRDDGAYLIKNLAQAVRFQACSSASFNHGVSQFDGGFVITRPQCVHFTVTADGRAFPGDFPAAAPCNGWRPVPARD